MTGGSNGSPGTVPTDLQYSANGITGITTTIANTGSTTTAADGTTIYYFDLNLTGTPSATGTLLMYLQNSAHWPGPLTPSAAVFSSVYLASLSAGGASLTNVSSVTLSINGYDSGFSFTESVGTASFNSSLSTSAQKYGLQFWPQNAATVYPNSYVGIAVTSGQAINVTLRIGSAFIGYDPTTNITSGTWNVLALLDSLSTAGIISTSDYVSTVQIGPEITGNAGTLTLSSYSVTQN